MEAYDKEYRAQRHRYIVAKDQIVWLEREIERRDAVISAAEEQAQAVNSQLREAKVQMKQDEGWIKHLEEKMEELIKEKEELEARVKSMTGYYAKLRREMGALQRAYSAQEAAMSTAGDGSISKGVTHEMEMKREHPNSSVPQTFEKAEVAEAYKDVMAEEGETTEEDESDGFEEGCQPLKLISNHKHELDTEIPQQIWSPSHVGHNLPSLPHLGGEDDDSDDGDDGEDSDNDNKNDEVIQRALLKEAIFLVHAIVD